MTLTLFPNTRGLLALHKIVAPWTFLVDLKRDSTYLKVKKLRFSQSIGHFDVKCQ